MHSPCSGEMVPGNEFCSTRDLVIGFHVKLTRSLASVRQASSGVNISAGMNVPVGVQDIKNASQSVR